MMSSTVQSIHFIFTFSASYYCGLRLLRGEVDLRIIVPLFLERLTFFLNSLFYSS